MEPKQICRLFKKMSSFAKCKSDRKCTWFQITFLATRYLCMQKVTKYAITDDGNFIFKVSIFWISFEKSRICLTQQFPESLTQPLNRKILCFFMLFADFSAIFIQYTLVMNFFCIFMIILVDRIKLDLFFVAGTDQSNHSYFLGFTFMTL